MITTKCFPLVTPYIDFEEDMRDFFKLGFDEGYSVARKRIRIGATADSPLHKASNRGFADGALHVFRQMWTAPPVTGLNCDAINLEAYLQGWRCGFDCGAIICGCEPALQSDVSPYLHVPPCPYLDHD